MIIGIKKKQRLRRCFFFGLSNLRLLYHPAGRNGFALRELGFAEIHTALAAVTHRYISFAMDFNILGRENLLHRPPVSQLIRMSFR